MKCEGAINYNGTYLCRAYASIINEALHRSRSIKTTRRKGNLDDAVSKVEQQTLRKVKCKHLSDTEHIATLNIVVGQDVRYYVCNNPPEEHELS